MKSKRILSIKIVKRVDDCPDTSYLGEYSNRATSEYSIDRRHSEDCQTIEANHQETVNKLERMITYLDSIRRSPEVADPDSTEWEELDEAIDILTGLQNDATECDCGGNRISSREYRYFNPPVENYKGESSEDIRKYCRQDFDRMESLNNGQWCFIGISTEAEVLTGSIVQTIRSGACYGIESDSDRGHMESIEQEELDSLKSELRAIGFSSRAISKAFNPDSIEQVNR